MIGVGHRGSQGRRRLADVGGSLEHAIDGLAARACTRPHGACRRIAASRSLGRNKVVLDLMFVVACGACIAATADIEAPPA